MHFQYVLIPYELAGDRFLATDSHHDSAIQPSVYLIPPALSPYPDASKETGLPGVDFLDWWPWLLNPVN